MPAGLRSMVGRPAGKASDRVETGPKISIGAHALILALVAFGGPLFDGDDTQPIQIAEVSIVTSAEFDSMMSSAPLPQSVTAPPDRQDAPPEDTATDLPPSRETPPEVPEPLTGAPEPAPTRAADPAPVVPDQPEPDPVAPPTTQVEAPTEADTPQQATGSAVVIPRAQPSDTDSAGALDPDRLALLRPRPRPAPRIDNTPAPAPPTDAQTAPEPEQSSEPAQEVAEPEPVEDRQERAPAESTTEIVPDPDPDSAAPLRSARPRGRPSDIVQRAEAARQAERQRQAEARAEAEAEATRAAEAEAEASAQAREEARKAAEARAIEEAIKAAAAETAAQTAAQTGPPLTGAEKGALVLAVQECWNVPVGVQDAGNLVVVLSVALTEDGNLAGNPELLEPAGTPQGLIKQAYEAGRRALIRCAPYDLPKEKYAQWKQLEVVFNPRNMVLR